MGGYVLFQMWMPFRQSLIERHSFYVDQARKRLLSQFDNIEADADAVVEEWLERRKKIFNPEIHDIDDVYEGAKEAGFDFYSLLSDMREQTRLSIVAGMFHEWDKQLRDWLVREIQSWHHGANTKSKIWSAEFGQIIELLECFGWNIRKKSYFQIFDGCRLVVNVYKHGDGKSLDDLRARFPEYLENPLSDVSMSFSGMKYCNHKDLKISGDQFQEFSDAILAFWRDVPENVFDSQIITVPDWFQKAITKDENSKKNQKGEG